MFIWGILNNKSVYKEPTEIYNDLDIKDIKIGDQFIVLLEKNGNVYS